MKFIKLIALTIFFVLVSCSKDKDPDPEKTNQAPKVFNLTEVADKATEIELIPSFKWQKATDPDGDTISYDFFMDINTTPTTKMGTNLAQAQFNVSSDLEINTRYYWKVVAKDTKNNVTESNIFSFTTITQLPNNAPEDFDLLTLEDSSLDALLSPTFTWEAAIDPDGDTVSYDFYLDTDIEPTTKLGSDLEQTNFAVSTALLYNTTYYWTVVAKDDNANTTTQTFSFVTLLEDLSISVPFAVVEEVPIFPGCESAENKRNCFNEKMQNHIADNFIYPEEAINEGIQGRVNAIFIISKTGAIINIRVRGPHLTLENEALRILGLLPAMTPGKVRGENVDVPFSIPITFRL